MALAGLKVIELAGLAPGPYAGMLLADFGANVIRVDRTDSPGTMDVLSRGKRSIALDLTKPSARRLLVRLINTSDVLIDPFRPGVMERLHLGPEHFLNPRDGSNPRLIYARIAGFPPDTSYKDMAGHDLNYIALSGILAMMGDIDKPSFPLNLLADFAGGGLLCTFGILVALFSRFKTGRGQVVNTDMVSGARYVSAFPLLHKVAQTPHFTLDRGKNLLDGGAPFYSVYRCGDQDRSQFISVACLEPRFFKTFIAIFMRHVALPDSINLETIQHDRGSWPLLREYLERGFASKSRDEWSRIFHGTDACVAPVLYSEEASELSGAPFPIPHPRLSSTPAVAPEERFVSLRPGKHSAEILDEIGLSNDECRTLVKDGAVTGLGGRPPYKL